jgi:hypothetical protein
MALFLRIQLVKQRSAEIAQNRRHTVRVVGMYTCNKRTPQYWNMIIHRRSNVFPRLTACILRISSKLKIHYYRNTILPLMVVVVVYVRGLSITCPINFIKYAVRGGFLIPYIACFT